MKTYLWGERMKKIKKSWFLFLLILIPFLITGCGKKGESEYLKELEKKVNNAKSYQVQGTLEISNNDDTYHYDVVASYKNPDFYRVSLKNQANNHEQIILKNNEGVYVLTPSLNKSFKFQSEWPYNNSQIYLLKSLVDDIKNDNEKDFVENENEIIFTTKVNYPNNRKLAKQQVVLNKDLNFKMVTIFDEGDIPQMKMTFTNIDLNPTFNDNYFDLNEAMNTCATCKDQEEGSSNTETKETASIDDIIFPLYIPSGTKLTDQDKIAKTNGERVILTFDGEKPFLLVEETADISDEFAVIPTYGEPYLLSDTVGSLADNSVTWTSNGIEYYLVSDVMSQDELIEVARSVSAIPTMK